ncbi:hypothetical protein [Clostridium sp.]|uniref:hypothetical protein n=1 Tax=Clostridium sp. TaxID=1506 RepID=UPI00283C4546|nr:hypothetical protein [Clostridium sp.]MDR3597833.1 hypothetical protein [Clostridium sp.]
MKSKLIALTIACATMFVALPVGANASWRQAGQGWYQFNTNENIQNGTIFDNHGLDSKDDRFTGNLIIINITNTTGSAVAISFDSTTGSAVTFPINITTDSAVSIPMDITTCAQVSLPVNIPPDMTLPIYDSNNFDDVINESNKEREQLCNFINKTNDEIDKQFDKVQKQFDRAWNFMRR